jgi:hypothetical protein
MASAATPYHISLDLGDVAIIAVPESGAQRSIWLSVWVVPITGTLLVKFLRGPGMILSWSPEARMNRHFRSGPTHSAN